MRLFRHPALLALEAVASVAVAGIWQTGLARAAAESAAPMEMAMAALGEYERADGSWVGVDLLAQAFTQEFGVTLDSSARPIQPVADTNQRRVPG